MSTAIKSPAGTTILPFSGFYFGAATVFGASSVAETSEIVINCHDFEELVLLTRVTALAGTPTVTVRVYNLDALGNRYPTGAIVTRTITANGEFRDTIAAPLGQRIEITRQYTIGGMVPAATLRIEADLKT